MGQPAAAPRARTGRAGKTLADRVDRMFLVAQRARHLENVFVPCREGLFFRRWIGRRTPRMPCMPCTTEACLLLIDISANLSLLFAGSTQSS
jgi:hypothetical protein